MSKTPVILQVVPSLKSGGVERGTLEIARAISARGWKALVVSSGGPMASQIPFAGAEHIHMPVDSKNPFVMWLNAYRLAKLIRSRGVDIIHARSRAPAWSALLAARKTGCRFITTFHGVYGLQNDWKRRYNSVMTRGDRVIAISNFIATHIREHYQTDPSRIRIIQRGVDRKLFHPGNYSPQRMIDLTRQWHIPDHLPMILFPGRITRWKGQDVFIRALQKLPHRHFFAVILGDAKGHESYRTELEKLIVDSDLGGHARLVPHSSKITDAYMLARVVVATSLEPEAFGRVALEAQAMGRPIIATNHGGAQETVRPGETGWLTPPGDVDALAGALSEALSMSDEALAEMSRKAAENAANFSLETMCERTLAVYEEVLAPAAG